METVVVGVFGRKVCGGMAGRNSASREKGSHSGHWGRIPEVVESNATAGKVQGYRVSRGCRGKHEVYVPAYQKRQPGVPGVTSARL